MLFLSSPPWGRHELSVVQSFLFFFFTLFDCDINCKFNSSMQFFTSWCIYLWVETEHQGFKQHYYFSLIWGVVFFIKHLDKKDKLQQRDKTALSENLNLKEKVKFTGCFFCVIRCYKHQRAVGHTWQTSTRRTRLLTLLLWDVCTTHIWHWLSKKQKQKKEEEVTVMRTDTVLMSVRLERVSSV